MAADINILAADHTNSTTTKTDMLDLSFVLLASTTYVFEFFLRATANAATVGLQYALTFPGTITRLDAMLSYWTSATVPGEIVVTGATTSPQNFNPTVSHGTAAMSNIVRGVIEVGGTGGTLTLQHGSETATLTTVQRNSYSVCSPI